MKATLLIAALLAQGVVCVAQAQTDTARRSAAEAAARAPNISEGDPIPEAALKVLPEGRATARQVRRTEAARAQKDGTIRTIDQSKY